MEKIQPHLDFSLLVSEIPIESLEFSLQPLLIEKAFGLLVAHLPKKIEGVSLLSRACCTQSRLATGQPLVAFLPPKIPENE